MDLSVTFLNLAGTVALLLWGVHMARTGVQRAFGARLRNWLGSMSRNRLTAFAGRTWRDHRASEQHGDRIDGRRFHGERLC